MWVTRAKLVIFITWPVWKYAPHISALMLYRVHLVWTGFELITSVVIGTDCIGRCKSNLMIYEGWPLLLYQKIILDVVIFDSYLYSVFNLTYWHIFRNGAVFCKRNIPLFFLVLYHLIFVVWVEVVVMVVTWISHDGVP